MKRVSQSSLLLVLDSFLNRYSVLLFGTTMGREATVGGAGTCRCRRRRCTSTPRVLKVAKLLQANVKSRSQSCFKALRCSPMTDITSLAAIIQSLAEGTGMKQAEAALEQALPSKQLPQLLLLLLATQPPPPLPLLQMTCSVMRRCLDLNYATWPVAERAQLRQQLLLLTAHPQEKVRNGMLIALKVARHTSHVTLHTSHVTRPPPSAHREMRLANALAGHAAAAVCAGVTAARAARQRHHRTPQVPR